MQDKDFLSLTLIFLNLDTVLYNIIQPLKITNFQRNRTEKKCVFALFQTLCKVAVLLTNRRCFNVRHGCLSSQIACYEDMWTIRLLLFELFCLFQNTQERYIGSLAWEEESLKKPVSLDLSDFKQWELPPN